MIAVPRTLGPHEPTVDATVCLNVTQERCTQNLPTFHNGIEHLTIGELVLATVDILEINTTELDFKMTH